MRTAEIRLSGDDDLVARLTDMRVWLDQQRIEPSTFTYFHLVPGVKLRVTFEFENEAVAFARKFGGTLAHEHRKAAQSQIVSAEAQLTQVHGRVANISLH
ncbi:MAG TPA: hypothetical protein VGF34_10450 [Stellaceae bacterium]